MSESISTKELLYRLGLGRVTFHNMKAAGLFPSGIGKRGNSWPVDEAEMIIKGYTSCMTDEQLRMLTKKIEQKRQEAIHDLLS